MTVEQTLCDLVAIGSVSSRSNTEIISYLARRCDASGFKITRLPWIDDNGIEKINLVAQIFPDNANTETESVVELALVGHTDTVPDHRNGSEALRLTEKNGRLMGRGACDTKAFISAALTAIESFDLSRLDKSGIGVHG